MQAISFKGTRWYKCDLHLHTPASKCFLDENVTAELWVQRAIDKGLDCVAVTDHNSADMIDKIKTAAEQKGLTVFPGVEITCDTAKIHLLVLFEIDKGRQEVEDFLIRCKEKREEFGEQEASTNMNIFEVAEIANTMGALVVPAHIDEFNGLNIASKTNLEKFFSLGYINAIQLVHPEFLDPKLNSKTYAGLIDQLNENYGLNTVDNSTIKDWHTAAKVAQENNQTLLTFSDNPAEPKSSKHGLDGIGSNYTWIKMDEKPSLEGLRQAFLLSKFRVKCKFESSDNPYKLPNLWIKSITIRNTNITEGENPLKVDFSPQLTTIIGGRGSGKSSILRFIRGVFDRTEEIKDIEDILKDQNEFYKRTEKSTKKGVLTDQSSIDIEFIRNKILYKITASSISEASQNVSIHKLDSENNTWIEITDHGFIDFFEFEQYSQKQIYEISQDPNSLITRIDKAIPEMIDLKHERELVKKTFLEKSATIRTIRQIVSSKDKLKTEIKDLEERIKLFNQSGISTLIDEKGKYLNIEEILNAVSSKITSKEKALNDLIENWEIEDTDLSDFMPEHQDELNKIIIPAIENVNKIKSELDSLKAKLTQIRKEYEESYQNSQWKKGYDAHILHFTEKKLELEQNGIDDLSNIEKLNQNRIEKEKELEQISEQERILAEELKQRNILLDKYLECCKEITKKRSEFVKEALMGQKVQININGFRNKSDFVLKLRAIIKRELEFQNDVESLTDLCFNGNVEAGINKVKSVFTKVRNGEPATEIHGSFANLIRGMNDSDIDEIEIMMPEDEVSVKYKPEGSNAFKPLSTGSAGQKTTAILTFILSHGNVPLILDQPEDDLDNKLVYELIVDRLKFSKEKRQIIVVTHNANIPVNGDAEYIVSMDSESKLLKVLHTGSVEHSIIKKEVCDVMEGSEYAFKMRSKRYQIDNI